MRIAFHDYPGHAFPVQLARALAKRGHEVLHLTFSEFQAPKGPLAPRPDDPPGLHLKALSLGTAFKKYSFVQRALQERSYAKLLVDAVAAFKPDVILGGNAPLDPQAKLLRFAQSHKTGFLFWHQDVYGVAMDKILRAKIPVFGALIGAWYKALEKRLWRASDRIVAITDDFVPLLTAEGIGRERIAVIENWGAREDLPPRPQDNPWSQAQGLVGKTVFMYSGTLGLKHNPQLLAALARAFKDDPEVRVLVVTEGIGADWLAEAKAREGLDNLILLPFQPFSEVPNAIGTSAALVVLLEPDAGVYSVPSKTLAYLCADRPLLGAIPLNNLAAKLITREGAGLVAAPDDEAGFVAAARRLRADPALRAAMAARGKAYADHAFDIDRITDQFERLLTEARDRARV